MDIFKFEPFEGQNEVTPIETEVLRELFTSVDWSSPKQYLKYETFRLIEASPDDKNIKGTFTPFLKKFVVEKYQSMWVGNMISKMFTGFPDFVTTLRTFILSEQERVFSGDETEDNKYKLFGCIMIHEFIRLILKEYDEFFSPAILDNGGVVPTENKRCRNFLAILTKFPWISIKEPNTEIIIGHGKKSPIYGKISYSLALLSGNENSKQKGIDSAKMSSVKGSYDESDSTDNRSNFNEFDKNSNSSRNDNFYEKRNNRNYSNNQQMNNKDNRNSKQGNYNNNQNRNIKEDQSRTNNYEQNRNYTPKNTEHLDFRKIGETAFLQINPSEIQIEERLANFKPAIKSQALFLTPPVTPLFQIMACGRVKFDDNGRTEITILRPPIPIDSSYKRCEIHSGFSKIAALQLLTCTPDLNTYYGLLTENGDCYDNCHSNQRIPLTENEFGSVIEKIKTYDNITNDFKVAAEELRIIVSLKLQKEKIKKQCNTKVIDSENNSLRYATTSNQLNDLNNFLRNVFFMPTLQKATSNRYGNGQEQMELFQQINVIDNTFLSSFFSCEDKVEQSLFSDKFELDFWYIDSDNNESKHIPIILSNLSDIVLFFETTTKLKSEIYKFDVLTNIDEFNRTLLEFSFDFETVIFPDNLTYILSQKYIDGYDKIIFNIRKFSEIIVDPSNLSLNISSYETNCYNVGYNVLLIGNYFENDDGIKYRSHESCRNLGACFIFRLKTLTRLFNSDSLTDHHEMGFFDLNFTINSTKFEHVGNYVKIKNEDELYAYIPKDLFEQRILTDSHSGISGKYFPICSLNVPFLTSQLFKHGKEENVSKFLLFENQQPLDLISNLKTFIIKSLVSGFEIVTSGEYINAKEIFDKENPMYLKKLERSTFSYREKTNCTKAMEIIKNVVSIDRDISLAKYKMLNNPTLFDNMYMSLCDSKGVRQNASVDNYGTQLTVSTEIINSKLHIVSLLKEILTNFIEDFLVNETIYNPTDPKMSDKIDSTFIESFSNASFISEISPEENQTHGSLIYYIDRVFSEVPIYNFQNTGIVEQVSFLSKEFRSNFEINYDIFDTLPMYEQPISITNELIEYYFRSISSYGTARRTLRIVEFIPHCKEIMAHILKSGASIDIIDMVYISKLSAAIKFAENFKENKLEAENKWITNSTTFIFEEIGEIKKKIKTELRKEEGINNLKSKEDWINYFINGIRTMISKDSIPMYNAIMNEINFEVYIKFINRRNTMILTLKNLLLSLKVTKNILSNNAITVQVFKNNELSIIGSLGKVVKDRIDLYTNGSTHVFFSDSIEDYVLPLNERLTVLNDLVKFITVKKYSDITTARNIVSLYILKNNIELFKRMYIQNYIGKYERSSSVTSNYASVTSECAGIILTKQKLLSQDRNDIQIMSSNKVIIDKQNIDAEIELEESIKAINKRQINIKKIYINSLCFIIVLLHFYDNNKLNNNALKNAIIDLKKDLDQLDKKLEEIGISGLNLLKFFRRFVIDLYKIKIKNGLMFKEQNLTISEIDSVFIKTSSIMKENLEQFNIAIDPDIIIRELSDSIVLSDKSNIVMKDFYDLFLDKIETIQLEARIRKLESISFLHSKFSTFLDPLNSYNGSYFSSYTVDENSFNDFVAEQNNIIIFVKSVIEAMSIIDSGPGYRFTSIFCKLLYKLKICNDDVEKDDIKNRLFVLRLRMAPFKINDCLSTTNFINCVNVLNGSFFGYYKILVEEGKIEALDTFSNINETNIRELILFMTSNDTNFDAFIEKYDESVLLNISLAFEKYIDEYKARKNNGQYEQLNDSLVLELRQRYILKSDGECFKRLFVTLSKYLDKVRRNSNEIFNSNIHDIFMGYVSGIIDIFTGRLEVEKYMLKRNN